MSPPVDAVSNSESRSFPRRVDVLVIGGGIVGCSTAYFLARKGISVCLLEKGRIAGEQSSRNWGYVRQQGRDEREIDLARVSLPLWQQLQMELGCDLGFRKSGVLYATLEARKVELWREWAAMAKEHGVESQLLDAREIQALVPRCTVRWVGGLYTPSDGRAEPALAAPAIARGAQTEGALIYQGCAVRGMETSAGRVSTVFTERGEIRANAVVCAAGFWTSMFCRRHGLDLPQLSSCSSVLATEPVKTVLEGAMSSELFAMRRRVDGGYTVAPSYHVTYFLEPQLFRYFRRFLPMYKANRKTIKLRINQMFFQRLRWPNNWAFDRPTPFESVRILDPKPDSNDLEYGLSEARKAYPALEGVRVAFTWAGIIEATPDSIPVISPIARLPGFFVATGFSGHGFGVGPGAGQLMADLVSGDRPKVDAAPFAYERLVSRDA